jgi:hypothetical protein
MISDNIAGKRVLISGGGIAGLTLGICFSTKLGPAYHRTRPIAKMDGKRPVVLLSRDESYDVRSLVIIAPVTTQIRDIPVEVSLGIKD